MAESFKCKRARFPKGKQGEFILDAKERLSLTWKELSEILGISTRNLIDWKNEKISLPIGAVKIICKKTNRSIPKDINILDRYWYTKKGARKGGMAVLKKYGKIGGDENIRKKKWKEWWEKEGKFLDGRITSPWSFKKPEKNAELAEFVGIVLGDGGISKKQVTITLHRITDSEYAKYVKRLVKNLFVVEMGVYENPRYLANDLSISRVELVEYLVKEVGLKIGNKLKNQADIPVWIKNDKNFCAACLRGLVDTDGSVFTHQYVSKGKKYGYTKMSYCSRSATLLKSASMILKDLDISHRITKNGFEIRIESQGDLKKYFLLIGSNNPKHLKKIKK